MGFLHWDSNVGVAQAISALALIVSIGSLVQSKITASRARPRPRPSTVFEAYDTREFAKGRLLWYWAIAIANLGGKTFSLDAVRASSKGLPLALLARQDRFLEALPQVSVFVFNRPEFENIVQRSTGIAKFRPKSIEELGALDFAVPAGETKTLYMALVVNDPEKSADSVFLNVELAFNTGDAFNLSKMVGIQPAMNSDHRSIESSLQEV